MSKAEFLNNASTLPIVLVEYIITTTKIKE